jgi:hypothetical protein
MFNLTINSTKVANSLNNMYQYQFKNGAFEVPANVEMMITSFQIPYSWYNITSRYNNNTFNIHWPSPTVNSITLTNGGSGYTSVPTVVFTGTNTTPVTATATIAPTSVASTTITTPGSGYTSAPTVAFDGGGGTGATGTVLLTPTSIEVFQYPLKVQDIQVSCIYWWWWNWCSRYSSSCKCHFKCTYHCTRC